MKQADYRPRTSLSEFRHEHSLAQELPYWDFVDDVVVLADGSLVKPLRLKGRAVETLDTDAINQLNQDIRSFLNSLPDNTELSFVVDINSDCRRTINAHLNFADPSSDTGWVAESRGCGLRGSLENLELVKTDLYLFLFLRPESSEGDSKLGFFKKFFQPPSHFHSVTKGAFEKRLHALQQARLALAQSLAVTGVECQDMRTEDTKEIIYRFLNPKRSRIVPSPQLQAEHRSQEFSTEELRIAPELALSSPREQLAFSDLLVDYDSFLPDGMYHRVLTLKTLPELTHSALITKLLDLPFHYSLHCHVQVPVQSKELSQLQSKRRMAEPERYRLVTAQWPAIIPESLFNEVQSQLIANAHHPGKYVHKYRLTGLIRCSLCGQQLFGKSGTGRSGKYFYYGHLRKFVTINPDRHKQRCALENIPAVQVEEAIIARLSVLAKDKQLLMELLKSNTHHMAGRLGQLDSLILSKEQEGRRIEKHIDGIMLSMADAGTSSRKLLTQKLDESVDLKTAIENEIRSLRDQKSNLKGSVIELNDGVRVIRAFVKGFDKRPVHEQKEILKDVMRAIVVHPDKLVLEIYGKEAEEEIPFGKNEGLPAELAGGSSELEHCRTAVRTAFRVVEAGGVEPPSASDQN